MSVRVEDWIVRETTEERRGRSPIYTGDPDFEVGQIEPTRQNVGYRVAEAQLQNYSGSLTNVPYDGYVFDRLAITGQFRPNRSCVLRDCLILGGPAPNPGQDWALVDTRSLSITTPVRVEHSTLSPSHRSVDLYGFKWGHVDAYRCLIEGVVDGGSPHGSGQWPSTIHREVRYRACMFTDSPWYEHDPRQTDGSHNDFIQAHGSLSLLEVHGCSFGADGEKADTSILVQQQHGLYDAIRITDNWFYGHPSKGAVFNMTESRGVPFTNLQFWRNRIAASSNHSSPSPIAVASGSRFPENFGWTGTVGSSPSTWVAGPNASVYLDGPNAGEPVRPKAG